MLKKVKQEIEKLSKKERQGAYKVLNLLKSEINSDFSELISFFYFAKQRRSDLEDARFNINLRINEFKEELIRKYKYNKDN